MTDQEPPTTAPNPKPPLLPLALTALILGGVAFLFGLVPIIGILFALAGLTLGIIALVKKQTPTWMPTVGTILSGLALVAAIAAIIAPRSLNTPELSASDETPVAVETQEATPEPVATVEPDPEPALTMGQQQAINRAEEYLAYSAFSRKGLIEQLKFEGFSSGDAKFAVDHVEVDWNEQAALKAAQYLEVSSFSKKGLTEQLIFEGFTKEQAAYGVKAVGF